MPCQNRASQASTLQCTRSSSSATCLTFVSLLGFPEQPSSRGLAAAAEILNGQSVVSFCILKLHNLTLWPLPPVLGFDTISCAYQCRVIDNSSENPEPSVYVVSRNTNLPVISRFAPVLFSGTMRMVQTSIAYGADEIDILAAFPDGKKKLFAARVRPSRAPETLDSSCLTRLNRLLPSSKKAPQATRRQRRKRLFFKSRPEGKNDL